MRSFAKISPRFWTPISKARQFIRNEGPEVLLVAVYLQSCPMSNALGLFYLPLAVISHETGLSTEQVLQCLAALEKAGFAEYCEQEQVVWIPGMAAEQVGRGLKPQDHRVKWIQRELQLLEESRFYGAFLARYGTAYNLLREVDCPGRDAGETEARVSESEPESGPTPVAPGPKPAGLRQVRPSNTQFPAAPPGWRPPRRRPGDPPEPSARRMKLARELDRQLLEATGES